MTDRTRKKSIGVTSRLRSLRGFERYGPITAIDFRLARNSGPTAEPGTLVRSMSMEVSVTMIQSVREKELHLLQQPLHPVTVVRDLKRPLPSRSRFSTSPSRAIGFSLLLPPAHMPDSPDRRRSEHPSAL